jgi:signal transduction histidine kinase
MWKNVVAPTLLVIFFWGLSSIATAYYIQRLEAVPKRMILEDLTTIHAADQMRFNIGALFRAIAGTKDPVMPEKAAEIKRIEADFLKHHEEAVRSATSSEEVLVDQQIKTRFTEFCQEIDRQIAHPPQNDTEGADNIRRLMRITGSISKLENHLGEINGTLMKELATSRMPATASLTAIRYGLLIVGPAAGILCGFWISRGFHRSISRISITLDDVASEMREHVGRVDVRQSGELPKLQEQVNAVVSRIRQVMQQLSEARQQAITGARLAALGEMAAGVAHELRNPLTSVKLLIQTGAQRPDRSMNDKQFRVVLEEISRMETTIERMLDFARPPRMNRTRHDVREIVTRALNVNEGRAHHAGVEIVSAIPPAPINVNGDAEQLHQVFSNLLQNAIEAMPGGGTLRLAIEPDIASSIDSRLDSSAARRMCRVVVADTGPGISSDVMRRIFEPFVTDKARGTGLGLAVSYRIVRDHDGNLTAENRPAGGAVFTVELPLIAAGVAEGDNGSAKPSVSRDPVPVSRVADPENAHAQVAHH